MPRKSAKSLNNPGLAVAYLRVSTEEQHLGPEAQRKQIERWAERESVTVAAWHVDQGISGAAGIDKRPGLAAALNDLRARRAGWLVVAKRDRLARDVLLAGAIEGVVRRSGGRMASADGAPVGDEPGEVMHRQMGDVFAQYERAITAARTKAALAVKKARGEVIGNLPYGYRWAADEVHLEEDEGEQRVIERARELRSQGLTLRAIAGVLSGEFKTRVGTAFLHPQVGKMLGRSPAPGVPSKLCVDPPEAGAVNIDPPKPSNAVAPKPPPLRDRVEEAIRSLRRKGFTVA
jgi:DNA invertase Pin-like site-specific DNA recombinase